MQEWSGGGDPDTEQADDKDQLHHFKKMSLMMWWNIAAQLTSVHNSNCLPTLYKIQSTAMQGTNLNNDDKSQNSSQKQ